MFARFGRGFPGAPGGYPGEGFGMRPRLYGPHLFPFGGLLFAILVIALLAVVVFLYWRILQKAGFEGALALLMFVPLVNLGLVAYLALADWPVLKELREGRLAYATTAVPEVTPPAEAPASAEDAE